jgi:glycosyltransferase involved in cell wall biosynthesis
MVATRVGGNAEVLPGEQRGLLVLPRRPQELGLAMQRLARMSAVERRAMGDAARVFVLSHFGMGAIVDEWERLYVKLMAQAGVLEVLELSR